MLRRSCLAIASILLALGSQPCLAADDYIERHNMQHSSDAFGGVTFRVPLGTSADQKPSLRLRATIKSSIWDTQLGRTLQTEWPLGLELGLNGAKKPNLYIGGQNAAAAEPKLPPVSGDVDTVLLIVVGIAVVALLLVGPKKVAAAAAGPR